MLGLTSLKSSKIYITLKMSLGRVFKRYFLFLFFTRKMKIEPIYNNCHMLWRLSHQNYSFTYNTKIYTEKSHTLFITKKTLVCCKAINSCYIKLQKLITFGIRLGICVLSYHYTFIFSFRKPKLWVLATAGC